MNLTIHCPHCGQHYELDTFHEGDDVQCAACTQHFTLSAALVDTNPSVRDVSELERSSRRPHASQPRRPAMSLPSARDAAKPSADPMPRFHTPVLSIILNVLATLQLLLCVAGFILKLTMEVETTNAMVILFLSALIDYGCSQIISYIGQIRHHAIRQTELLTQIRDSLAAQASNGEGNSHDM